MAHEYFRSDGALDSPPLAAASEVSRNRLLAALPQDDPTRLREELQPVYLARGTSLFEPATPLTHLYFPTWGVLSLGNTAASGDGAEVTVVGREGVAGVEAFLGADTASHRALAQTHCLAYRVSAGRARLTFARSGPFHRALLAYTLDLMLQISHTSTCNLHHPLRQRVSRAILQFADRLSSSKLPMTHDVLATLVNVRRQGVSEAVQDLRDLGVIASRRGSIVVLDRGALLAHACECYPAIEGRREPPIRTRSAA